MEKTMIRLKTGECYRVPEDMFPIPAQNLVDVGRADWIERKKPGVVSKAIVRTAALIGNARTAARDFVPFYPRGAAR